MLGAKKQAVALHRNFYEMLPVLPQVAPEQAEMAWLTYDLSYNAQENRYHLVHDRTVYTRFEPALQQITRPSVGTLASFTAHLQTRLDSKREENEANHTGTLNDLLDE